MVDLSLRTPRNLKGLPYTNSVLTPTEGALCYLFFYKPSYPASGGTFTCVHNCLVQMYHTLLPIVITIIVITIIYLLLIWLVGLVGVGCLSLYPCPCTWAERATFHCLVALSAAAHPMMWPCTWVALN